ncbi:ankyrin [Apostichopus japonicus]|uniref:Ankyrin n=1 Tax=Stichopus japonicus TaxID=307972 RepID=A0A2G8LQZ7_STIJA|nr:ankyrin [Apostichopus japonicus]
MIGSLLLVVLLASWSTGSFLLPFGPEYEDKRVTGQKYIELDNPINLDGEQYQLIAVNKRGYLSLKKAALLFSKQDARVSVIEEEDDLTKSKPIDVFFRLTNDTDMKYAIDSLIEKTHPTLFKSDQLLITTWVQHGCQESPKSEVVLLAMCVIKLCFLQKTKEMKRTTQCVLASDAVQSYAVYLTDGGGACKDGHVTLNDEESGNIAGNVPASRHLVRKQEAHHHSPVVVQLHRDPLPGGPNATVSDFEMFQLSTERGNCLSLSQSKGYVISCNDDNGRVERNTVFRLHGSPGNQQMELFGSGQCLDREHCHSSSSNLRSSDCSHCGAIHWYMRGDGTLREDNGANCIYVVESTNQAEVHHSSSGCTSFHVIHLGDIVQFKSPSKGDCLGNGVFVECNLAGRFRIYNLPRQYQLKDARTGFCFDREHCHASTSNTRLSTCSHCGAIHWSIENIKVGEDDMKNCVNRGTANSAVMKHCSDGWEKLNCEISTSVGSSSSSTPTNSSSIITGLPKPDISYYMKMMPHRQISGARLYKEDRDGFARLEFVHALPNQNTFHVVTNQGVLDVQYWVVTINTMPPQ